MVKVLRGTDGLRMVASPFVVLRGRPPHKICLWHIPPVLFSGGDVHKPVGLLSGGEAARLIFALLAVRQPNVLVLDEPTNHLDLEAIAALDVARRPPEPLTNFLTVAGHSGYCPTIRALGRSPPCCLVLAKTPWDGRSGMLAL